MFSILRQHFKGKLLSQIDYKALEDFRDLRKDTPVKFKYKEPRPRSERKVDMEMAILRRMFKKASLPVKGRYVFPGVKDGPRNIKRSFQVALKKSGIDPGEGMKKVVFHTLRHSCVSQLVERGADTSMVRNYINHASSEMTEHYTHISEEFQRKTGQLLDGLYDVQKIYGQKMVRNEEQGKERSNVSA